VPQERSYISFLARDDDYLKGLLVLHYSLQKTKPRYPFLLLAASNLSRRTLRLLEANNIAVRIIEPINNPFQAWAHEKGVWENIYSKLSIFDQKEFDKIVYLDADMLICKNIDELFEKPHMSAVNAGGMLPELSSWVDLNSGLLVVEPQKVDAKEMFSEIGKLEVRGPGDQDFLHAYYPDWPKQRELHLDHKFNMLAEFLDRYHELFGYQLIRCTTISESEREDEKTVHVVHYIGQGAMKPWRFNDSLVDPRDVTKVLSPLSLFVRSVRLWRDFYHETLRLRLRERLRLTR